MIGAVRLARVVSATALVFAGCTGSTSSPSVRTAPTTPGAAAVSPTPPTTGRCANLYQPVVEGAVWTYHTTSDTAGDVRSIDVAVDTRRVMRGGFRTVTSVPGGSFPVDWRCVNEGLVQSDLGDLTPGGPRSLFRVTRVVGVTFPAGDLRGKNWRQSYSLAGSLTAAGQRAPYAGSAIVRYVAGDRAESVDVPAGTYDALMVYSDMVARLRLTVAGRQVPLALEVQRHSWYVRGVGMVKQVSDATIGFAHVQIAMLLSDVTGLGQSF